jgi:hypothetical protein
MLNQRAIYSCKNRILFIRTLPPRHTPSSFRMKRTLSTFAVVLVFSCTNPKVKYSGLNDLVVGVQQVVLYENKRFYLELGLGGTEGEYSLKGDTIIFNYDQKPAPTWPDKLILTRDYFLSIDSKVRIRRNK